MRLLATLILALTATPFFAQQEQLVKIGGQCEGCEALYEYGNQNLSFSDTIVGFAESSQKLKVFGTVFESDGTTPASDIIIYIYHTDQKGKYKPSKNAQGWERRHGQYRGWVKTDASGKYAFYTFRPASYPNTSIPQHIHTTVKEPETVPYFIDDVFFADDPYLTDGMRNGGNKRGGSGIVTPEKRGEMWVAKRDIYLRKNVPTH